MPTPGMPAPKFSPRGLGNLVIGYNEDSGDDDRSGSHNLIVGGYHSYSSKLLHTQAQAATSTATSCNSHSHKLPQQHAQAAAATGTD